MKAQSPTHGEAYAAAFEALGRTHMARLNRALRELDGCLDMIGSWGARLAGVLPAGARLLVCGNGGSAAQAQHLTAELVGRYRDDRPAFSAIALHGDTSSLTAIGNDYGFAQAFARQVRAHGRPGDVLLGISTSGRSPNVLEAVEAAASLEMETWSLTGPGPNALQEACGESVCVHVGNTATVQEVHQVALHLLCEAFELALAPAATGSLRQPRAAGMRDASAPLKDSPATEGVRG